jgi:energy-coupling factor transporter ATP-binding protein EcfA2
VNRDLEFPGWWWGPFGADGDPRPFQTSIADGIIDAELGAWLWLLIERGASTIVCAGPSGAGKSTLLTSLLPCVHPARNLHFARGRYERFERIDPPVSALLINEISPHLPIYLWGPGVARAHQLAGEGAQLMATAHAESSGELLDQLASFPNNVPKTSLASWDLVILLRARIEGRMIHREIRAVDSIYIDLMPELAVDKLAIRIRGDSRLHIDFDALRRLAGRLRIDPSILDAEISQRMASLLDPGSMRHRSHT